MNDCSLKVIDFGVVCYTEIANWYNLPLRDISAFFHFHFSISTSLSFCNLVRLKDHVTDFLSHLNYSLGYDKNRCVLDFVGDQ